MGTGLIGHTGFLGGNLARQFSFDHLYNSGNIAEIRAQAFDLLVCAGVVATKWWANQNPVDDRARIDGLLEHLRTVKAKQVIAISTVDVYPVTSLVDETFPCESMPNHPYGANRLYFEDGLRDSFPQTTVVRISGVFGPGLKKNVIYDLLHDNCLQMINPQSTFQYYNALNLWNDLEAAGREGIQLLNLVSEPVRTGDIIDAFFPGKLVGAKAAPAAHYDIRTLYSACFGGPLNYTTSRLRTMAELERFVTAA